MYLELLWKDKLLIINVVLIILLTCSCTFAQLETKVFDTYWIHFDFKLFQFLYKAPKIIKSGGAPESK